MTFIHYFVSFIEGEQVRYVLASFSFWDMWELLSF